MHNYRRKKHFYNNHIDYTNLVISSLAGGAIGISAALLLMPKSKSNLWNHICEECGDWIEKAEEFEEDLEEKGHKAYCDATNFAKDKASEFIHYAQSSKVPLLVGAIGAGILGISAALILTSKNTSELKKVKGAAKELSSIDWHHLANQLKEGVHSLVEERSEEVEEEISKSPLVNEVLDWAVLGIRLWNNMKKRR